MKKIILILSIFSSSFLPAQSIIGLQNQIDSLKEIGNSKELLILLEKQKRLVDFQYYQAVFNSIGSIEDDRERFLTIASAQKIPFYLYDGHGEMTKIARDIYLESSKLLIEASEGNLKILEQIKIVPSCRSELYPQLRYSILRAGGTWKHGPIPLDYGIGGIPVSGPLIPADTLHKN